MMDGGQKAGHGPYERGGYRWDLGQLLIEGLGPDEPLGSILATLGLTEKVPVRAEDRGYVFPDFALEKPEEYQGFQWRINRLKELFPGEEAGPGPLLGRLFALYQPDDLCPAHGGVQRRKRPLLEAEALPEGPALPVQAELERPAGDGRLFRIRPAQDGLYLHIGRLFHGPQRLSRAGGLCPESRGLF